MRHNKNFIIRMSYFLIMLFFYNMLFKYFKLPRAWIAYFTYLLIMTINYLIDNLNFKAEEDFFSRWLYMFIANSGIFGIYFIFTKEIEFIYVGIIFMLVQTIASYIVTIKTIIKNRILVYGDGKENITAKEVIEKNSISEYVGFLGSKDGALGNLEDVYDISKKYGICQIVLLDSIQDKIKEDIVRLKVNGVKVISYMEFIEQTGGKVDVSKINNSWIIKSQGFEILNNDFNKRLKRLIDLIAALLVLIPSLPIMVIAAIIVKLESRGPIIFKQDRVGLAGEVFKIYKFRSMKLHDESKHSKYAQEKDNRITKFGNFMRKTRIDELPQLWNVFNGTMSFVGPRAEWNKLHDEYARQIPFYFLRASVKPGLTGWAQVMYPYGANLQDTINKLEYDLYYIKYQNFTFDVIIIIKTIKIVLFGMGR